MSERTFWNALADNFVGYDDGVNTPGERLGSGINALAQYIYNDPVGLTRNALASTEQSLNHMMFGGGARTNPENVLLAVAGAGLPMRAPAGSLRSVALRGGGHSDPTQTGWTFKDVNGNIGLSKAEQKRLSEGAIAPTEQVLPIRSMYAMQDRVNPDFATTESSAGMLPNAVRKDGKIFLQDGHHRVTKVAEEGGQNVRVNFFDFDRPDMSAPLLDYDADRAVRLKAEDAAILDELFADLEGDFTPQLSPETRNYLAEIYLRP